MIGFARTVDLVLTGRLLDSDEAHHIGLINTIVPQDQVHAAAQALGEELAAKPPVAMRLNRQRFYEMTEPGLQDALSAGVRIQREAYATGEPARMMEAFFCGPSGPQGVLIHNVSKHRGMGKNPIPHIRSAHRSSSKLLRQGEPTQNTKPVLKE